MSQQQQAGADAVLSRVTRGTLRVPGVVAMATDRDGDTFAGAAGERRLGGGQPMTADAVFRIFSCTKAITGVAAMQLVEDGRLNLDRPAKDYLPEIGEIGVMQADGSMRPPKTAVTTRMLLLHTAGFGYDFFNARYRDHGKANDIPSVVSSAKRSLQTPLLHEPGTAWEYGSNIDWAGRVVEAIAGKRLGEVMEERIFGPLGMTDTAFTIRPHMKDRLATMHARQADGSLKPMDDFEFPREPEVHMGGHGLYSTVPDYMKFIRMFLNDGNGRHGRVVKPETVDRMAENGLGKLKVKMLPGVVRKLSNDAEFFPGLSKSWGLTLMINDADAPTGRPAGGLGWAGLANLYYWIDRKNGLGGFWATQVFPFADATSFGGYIDFETAIYRGADRRMAA